MEAGRRIRFFEVGGAARIGFDSKLNEKAGWRALADWQSSTPYAVALNHNDAMRDLCLTQFGENGMQSLSYLAFSPRAASKKN